MGLMDVAAKAAQGFAGAAGDTDSQAQIGNWQAQRQNQRQQQLQLAIAPLSQSLAADRERLKAFTDPNTGEPVEEHQADYDKIHNRMVDTIGQMRELLGQHPPGETPFATRLLDKFHVANDLSNHFQNKRIDQVNQYYAQNRAMADAAANGSFEPNPYTAMARQLTQAGLSPAETQEAVLNKAGAVRDDQQRFINDWLPKHPDKTRWDAIRAYTDATTKFTRGELAPKVDEKSSSVIVTDPQTGATYSRSNIETAPEEIQRLYRDTVQGQKDKADYEEKKRQAANDESDRRSERQAAVQERMAEIREEAQRRMLEIKETSNIPPILASRLTQAQIIKEQVDDLRSRMQDPDIRKIMGPFAGRTAGALASLYSKKVRDFYTSQESLDALLPLLHGYRGGAQTHEMFRHAMGTLAVDPKAYEGTLDQLDRLADNVVTEMKQEYPNAPVFRNGSLGSSKDSSGGVVSIGDVMKKYPNLSHDQAKQAIIDQGHTPIE